MKEISTENLLLATGGTALVTGTDKVTAGLTTDSRAVVPGCIFLAISGARFDGNTFAAEASRRGAAAVVVSRAEGEFAPGCTVVLVEDTLTALQKLAAWWRQQLEPIHVVGLTGSSGKTGTKDMLAAVLGQKFRTVATKGNLNNHIGLPLSILATEKGTETAVWEMGMNHAGELAPLCAMVRHGIGIITTIGSSHIEFLGSRGNIAREKCTVARTLPADGTMIYPAGDDFAAEIAAESPCETMPVGGADSRIRAVNVRTTPQGSTYELCIDGQVCAAVTLPVPGTHMVANSLLAAAAGVKLGCTPAQIAAGLASVSLTKGRLTCHNVDGITVVDDTYNANPESMKAALETVAAIEAPGRRYAVLGKMGELGKAGIAAHRAVGERAAELGYTSVIIVGKECPELTALGIGAGETIPVIEADGADKVADLRSIFRTGDAVLFKGSRAAGIEHSMYAIFPELKPTEQK